eukprot:gene4665-8610_t
MATFANKPHYPCHFEALFPIDTPLKFVIQHIADKHDQTLQNIIVFQGDLRGGEVIQTSEWTDMDISLSEIGFIGRPINVAESAPLKECEIVYYDFNPDIGNLTAASLVTQDEYFLKNVLVPTNFSRTTAP